MSGISLLLVFTAAIILMIVSISKFKIHPFLAIMGTSLILGIVVGIPLADLPGVLGAGFAGIFTSIGLVIILGALIGFILERTGAAVKLAELVIRMVGKKKPELAMLIMGWVVSIPVFCDSGFVILDPIRKALVRRTKVSSVAMTVALSAGLYTSHVFIPPTPGPIAAAGTLGLGDNLLLVIAMGALISIPSLIAAYLFAIYIGKKVKSREEIAQIESPVEYEDIMESFGKLPSGFMSLAPIVVPIILMAMGSLANVLKWEGTVRILFNFLGNPLIALTVGLCFAIALLASTGKLNLFNEMTNETLKVVGPILFITAAGGVLGRIIVTAGFVDYIKANAAFISSVGIFFPFVISAILKSAQGSSTVALTTTAGIMGLYNQSGTMMEVLGLTTPMAAALTVMAIAAGAMTVSHANDSYFWVVTNFGDMTPEDGYKTQTAVTLVMGVVSMFAIFLLSLVLI